jgi:hypothetical protein
MRQSVTTASANADASTATDDAGNFTAQLATLLQKFQLRAESAAVRTALEAIAATDWVCSDCPAGSPSKVAPMVVRNCESGVDKSMRVSTVKSEPDVHEPSYDCAVCWLSVLEDLRSGTRVMTCSQCPAQNKVCAACYVHPLSNKSCGQCAGPLGEYQRRLSSKSSGADIIDVDAISAAPEDLLDHAAPAAATVLNSVRAEETVLLDMEQRKKTGRPPSYVLSAEDLAVLNTPGKTLADMVAHLGRKYPIITERIIQSLRTKRVPSAGRIDLRLRVTI